MPLISYVIGKIISWSNRYFGQFEKLIIQLRISFSKKSTLQIWTTKLKKALKRVWWPAWFWSKQRRPLTQLNVLLQKLYAVGFSKRAVTWLKNFISNRAFLDNLGNIFSHTASASCGIPQVSFFLWGRGDRRGGSGSCFRIR